MTSIIETRQVEFQERLNVETIYSTVPQEHISHVDPEKKAVLLSILRKNAGKFFTTYQLAQWSGFPARGTQVEVRKAITELIELEHHPIVGTVKGFSYATCSNMLSHYLESLSQRAAGLQRRISAVHKIKLKMEEAERQSINLQRWTG